MPRDRYAGYTTNPCDAPRGCTPLSDVTRLPIQLRGIERTGSRRHEPHATTRGESRWPRRRCRGHTSLYIGSPEDASVSAGTGATSRSSRTTGRRTGRPHTIPLACIHHRDGVAVVASNGGSDHPPDWWLNLQHQPLAEIELAAPNALSWHVSPTTMNRNRWRTRSARRTPASSVTANDRVEPSKSSSSPPRKDQPRARVPGHAPPPSASSARRRTRVTARPYLSPDLHSPAYVNQGELFMRKALTLVTALALALGVDDGHVGGDRRRK